MGNYQKSRVARFMEKVEKHANGCWIWKACRVATTGYGRFQADYAHRAAYQLFKGEIPAGFCVCHGCDRPECVNPEHLWLGSKRENSNDMARKGRAAQGETHTKAKISEGEVREIRSLEGRLAQKDIARLYGVCPSNVRAILSRKTWKKTP